jgi:hypothetical protein
MSHKRYIALDRKDLTLLHDMVQLADTSRAETLEAILDELLAGEARDLTLIAEEG